MSALPDEKQLVSAGAPEAAIKATIVIEAERNDALNRMEDALSSVVRLTTTNEELKRQASGTFLPSRAL